MALDWVEWIGTERDAGSEMSATFFDKWRDRHIGNSYRAVPIWERAMDYDLANATLNEWISTPLSPDTLRATTAFPIWVPPWAQLLVIDNFTSFQAVIGSTDNPRAYEIRLRMGSTYSSIASIVRFTGQGEYQELIPFQVIAGVEAMQGTVVDYEWEIRRITRGVWFAYLGESTYPHPSGDGSPSAYWKRYS